MSQHQIADPALDAYAGLAPFYDRFTAGCAYDSWLAQIEQRARVLGLAGRRVLDIGCGTGESFGPLLDRGYEVTGCDLSPEMIEEAVRKFDGRVQDLLVADMRELPPLGSFDLVTCIDDAINYLLSAEELVDTFRGVAGLLAADGVFAFDVNCLSTYRTAFAETFVREDDGGLFCWRGEAETPIAPGDVASATIEGFLETDDGLWQRVSSRHVQRHHPPDTIRDALAAAGLECVDAAGQRPGCRLDDYVDEAEHIKVVYFARLPAHPRGGESAMQIIKG
jgi:SAM-dependent methyltransferase